MKILLLILVLLIAISCDAPVKKVPSVLDEYPLFYYITSTAYILAPFIELFSYVKAAIKHKAKLFASPTAISIFMLYLFTLPLNYLAVSLINSICTSTSESDRGTYLIGTLVFAFCMVIRMVICFAAIFNAKRKESRSHISLSPLVGYLLFPLIHSLSFTLFEFTSKVSTIYRTIFEALRTGKFYSMHYGFFLFVFVHFLSSFLISRLLIYSYGRLNHNNT